MTFPFGGPNVPAVSRHRHRLSVVFAVVATSSCIDIPPLLAPGNPVDFCIEQAKAYCALEYRCCTAAERVGNDLGLFRSPAFSRWAPSTEDECVGIAADVCRGTIAEQNESLADERISYDAEEAESCLADLREAVDGCELKDFFKADGSFMVQLLGNGTPGVLGSACEDAVQGEVDDGDTCFASYECKRGGCVVQSTGSVTIKGECAGDFSEPNPFASFNGVRIEICDGLGDDEENE